MRRDDGEASSGLLGTRSCAEPPTGGLGPPLGCLRGVPQRPGEAHSVRLGHTQTFREGGAAVASEPPEEQAPGHHGKEGPRFHFTHQQGHLRTNGRSKSSPGGPKRSACPLPPSRLPPSQPGLPPTPRPPSWPRPHPILQTPAPSPDPWGGVVVVIFCRSSGKMSSPAPTAPPRKPSPPPPPPMLPK